MESFEKCCERWAKTASNMLVGKKIVEVRYMSKKEMEALGWTNSTVVIHLSDGTIIYPSMDDEGNDGGALFTTNEKCDTLPVIQSYESL
jgi:hypothetical protein